MKTNIETIVSTYQQILNGESAPAMSSPEFAEIMAAFRSICAAADPDRGFAAVGSQLVTLLLNHLHSSMHAERELALLRINSQPC